MVLLRGSEILTSSTLSGLFSFINTCQLELFFSLCHSCFFQLQNKCENLSRTIYLTSSCSPLLPFLVVIPHRSYCRHRRAVHTNRSSNWTRLVCVVVPSARWMRENDERRRNENKKIFTWSNIKLLDAGFVKLPASWGKRVEMWKFNISLKLELVRSFVLYFFPNFSPLLFSRVFQDVFENWIEFWLYFSLCLVLCKRSNSLAAAQVDFLWEFLIFPS